MVASSKSPAWDTEVEDPCSAVQRAPHRDGFRMSNANFAGRPGPDRHRRPRWKSHPSRQPRDSLRISLMMQSIPNGCDNLPKRAIRVPQPWVGAAAVRGGGGLSGAQVREVTSAGARTRVGTADGTGCSDYSASVPEFPFPSGADLPGSTGRCGPEPGPVIGRRPTGLSAQRGA